MERIVSVNTLPFSFKELTFPLIIRLLMDKLGKLEKGALGKPSGIIMG